MRSSLFLAREEIFHWRFQPLCVFSVIWRLVYLSDKPTRSGTVALSCLKNALKHKVKERNPWMKPEGYLSTWGNCALVILSRAKSYGWVCMDTVDSVSHDSLGHKNVLPVVAKPVGLGNGLNPSFAGLESHEIDCAFSLCERVHLAGENKESATSDLWKSAATLEPESKWEIVASQLAGNVLLFTKTLCITLPGTNYLFPEDIKSVVTNDWYVKVVTTYHVYLFSRNKPLHN